MGSVEDEEGIEESTQGLESGESPEMRALGKWPRDFGKSRIEEVETGFGHGTKCNTCAGCGPSSELSARAWGRTCTYSTKYSG